MKRAFTQLLYNIINQARLPEMLKYLPGKQVLVLNFHRVNPYNDPCAESLHPVIFDGLLDFIKRYFYITIFSDLELEDNPKKKPRMILSFDDGYYDLIEYAVPVMRKHGVRCNMNLIGSSLIDGKPPFVGRLSAAFRSMSDKQLSTLRIFGMRKNYSNAEGRLVFRNQVSNYLKSRSVRSREEIIERSSPWFKCALEECEFMAVDRMIKTCELRNIKAHDLGSHSFSHESMAYQNEDFFRDDFGKSKRLFQDEGLSHSIYAFPNGSFNEPQIDFLHRNGVRDVLLAGAKLNRWEQVRERSIWQGYGFHASTVREAKAKVFYASLGRRMS